MNTLTDLYSLVRDALNQMWWIMGAIVFLQIVSFLFMVWINSRMNKVLKKLDRK